MTAHKGPSEIHHKWKRETAGFSQHVWNVLTPLGLSGDVLNEQVCVDGLVISYQKQGRTDQTLLV